MQKILVVEDEPAYLKIIHDRLASEGYVALCAQDGKHGLAEALREKPVLILLDLRMPVMDGITMLKKLRQDAWGKDVYVIVLTNLDDSANISNTMHEKLSKYVVKSNSTLGAIVEDVKMFLR